MLEKKHLKLIMKYSTPKSQKGINKIKQKWEILKLQQMSMKEKSHKENKKQKYCFENITKVDGTLRGLIKKRGENSQYQE